MLSESREKIDQIDRQLVQLLENRLEIVDEVATIKSKFQIPVLDETREVALIQKVRSYCDKKSTADLVESLFIKIMAHSKEEQSKKINK